MNVMRQLFIKRQIQFKAFPFIIYQPMFEQKLNSFSQLPVKEKDRKCTDCLCTIIGAIFALTLFILAFVFMNTDHYYKTNFPTDSDGKPCAYGQNDKYPYVFFPDINDIQTRVCVTFCPESAGASLQCRTNSKVPSCSNVNTYPSSTQFQRLGGFCGPNSQAVRDKLVQNLNLQDKWDFLNTYDIIRLSLLIALACGVIWMALVQCLPRIMAIAAILFGSLMLVGFGILLIVDNPSGWQNYGPLKYIIGAFLIFFGLIFFITLFTYKRRIKLTGVFLAYAAKFLAQKPINFIFIPIFITLLLGLIVLCVFQYLAFSSNAEPQPIKGDVYLQVTRNTVLTILTIIEFIWGVQFLKDTFNFFISGNAAEWYIRGGRATNCCAPVGRFFKYNFGSVVGGSFLNAFFNFIDFLFELFRCYPDGACGACAPLCTTFSKCCGCFFDLVRNDAYSYINLTGIPYCNAARNCQVLCSTSKLFVGSQSVMFFYRLCAHIFLVGLTTLLCYFMMKAKIGGISVQSLFIILIFAYCVVTFFIDIHADTAEALQIAYLTQLELNGGNPDTLATDFQGLKGELRGLDHSYEDGKL